MSAGDFAAVAVALYAGHHVGDYWVQRDVDARHKGDRGWYGSLHCLTHVISYLATQVACLIVLDMVTGAGPGAVGALAGLTVSGVTHYIADRREPLRMIASWIPSTTQGLLKVGQPRMPELIREMCGACSGLGGLTVGGPCSDCHGNGVIEVAFRDNPQLATGLWALDQSWHIFWGVFVTALVMVSL